MIYNATHSVIYFLRANYSYHDIYRFRFDPNSGILDDFRVSSSNDGNNLLTPLFLSLNDDKVITADGNMFFCDSSYSADLFSAGDIGTIFTDMTHIMEDQNMILVHSSYYWNYPGNITTSWIKAISTDNYETISNRSLVGNLKKIIRNGDDLYVLTNLNTTNRNGAFLINYQELLNSQPRNKYILQTVTNINN